MRYFKLHLVCILFFSITSMQMFAQEKSISGKVTDDFNEGIPGVSVIVEGTTQGTMTDLNGNYSISSVDPNSTLIFSFVGYTPQKTQVKNRIIINIQLQEDTKLLDEVVVIAYGSAKKSDLTGALSTFRPDDKDAAKATSLDNLLSGKIAGLVVSTASANPGAASSVVIRGASSLRGDNQPLYIIDNVPQASTGEFAGSGMSGDFQIAQDPLASLNPNDIESITVLKDASSTAIYGSRGANGVILITTKKGKAGKAKVTASATYTIANATRLMKMMGLREYGEYMNSRSLTPNDPSKVQFHFVGDQVRYVFNDQMDKYDPQNPETYFTPQYRNWQKEIYSSAFSQSYSLSVSGGSDKTTYYVSANFKDISGIVKQTGLKQGDLRTTLRSDLSNTVKLNTTLSGSLQQNDMMAGGNTLGGSTGAISRTALDYAPFELPDNDPTFANENKTNIFSWLNDYVDLADNKSFKGSLDLAWQPYSFLRYNLRTGGNININERKRWYGMELYQGMNNQGYLSESNLSRNNYSVENMFSFNTKLGEIGTMDATAGVTYEEYSSINKNIIGKNFSVYDLRENGMHMAKDITTFEPDQRDYQLLSYLGRANFNFLEKYLVTTSLRADGSSKFASNNRWGYFPSASVAWRMEQENFIKDMDWLSQLKLRLSYGVTGNQSINPYSTFSMYGNPAGIVYADGVGNKETVMVVTNLPNNDLTWEKTASWNLGLDFSLFHTRLNGTIDIYHKKTNDLLISRFLPGSAGFGSAYYNQGSLTNQGVELTLNAQIIDTKDWKWSVSGNIGVNRAEIGDLGLLPSDFGNLGERAGYYGNSLGDHFGVGHVFLAGEAPGLFFGYTTQGIVQTNDITADGVKYTKSDGSVGYYKTFQNNSPQPGDIKYIDQNGDGNIDEKDREIIGDYNPDFTYGFQTSVSWNSLSLSATFQGVQGRDILNTNNRYINTPGLRAGNLTEKAFNNMWTENNASDLYPRSTYSVTNLVMDRYIEDGSYLRCSDITISYVLPAQWLRKIGFQNTSIYASVKNAFLITNYSGYDPEVNSFAFNGLTPGVDMNAYPNPRSFMFGVNLSF